MTRELISQENNYEIMFIPIMQIGTLVLTINHAVQFNNLKLLSNQIRKVGSHFRLIIIHTNILIFNFRITEEVEWN